MKIVNNILINNQIYFSGQNKSETEHENRLKQLKKKGVSEGYSRIFADYETTKYQRTLALLKKGVSPSCIEELVSLEDDKYNQAITLIKRGVSNSYIFQLASLEQDNFKKVIDYQDNGFDDDATRLFTELNDEEKKEGEKLIEEGFTPFAAGNLVKLTPEQRKIAIIWAAQNIEIEEACKIATLDEEKRTKCEQYLNEGIRAEFVRGISKLEKEEEKRLPEIFSLKIGDINIVDFAQMNEKDYSRAKELLKFNVNPDYILDIIQLENNETENPEYLEYRNRGYSYTSSFALSLLENEEIDMLTKLIEIHPEIKELFMDENDIDITKLQNNDDIDAIFTKKFRTPDGTLVKLVRTFDSYGDKTESRLEEYQDNSTSSYLKNNSSTIKIKYDKYGEVREMDEFIQDKAIQGVIGVIHTKASEILQGAFESVYYDINDFIVDTTSSADYKNIEDCVTSRGEAISTIKINQDGSISYDEGYQFDNFDIERHYTEKKDKNNQITSHSYQYRIKDINKNEYLMDINSSMRLNEDGTATNNINGIEYNLSYNDKNKTIRITDGENIKVLNFKKKLPLHSEEIIWNNIKQLSVDNLLTIYKNIKNGIIVRMKILQ